MFEREKKDGCVLLRIKGAMSVFTIEKTHQDSFTPLEKRLDPSVRHFQSRAHRIRSSIFLAGPDRIRR